MFGLEKGVQWLRGQAESVPLARRRFEEDSSVVFDAAMRSQISPELASEMIEDITVNQRLALRNALLAPGQDN